MWIIMGFIPEHWKQMGFWSRDSYLPPEPVLVTAGVLLLAWGLWSLVKVSRRRWQKSESLRLFNRIAAERGLSVQQRWQLWRLARQRGLTTPLTLMVCEATLNAHTTLASKGLSSEASERLEQNMAMIRKKLYG